MPRFTIRRADVAEKRRAPWALKDSEHPAYLSQHRTFASALAKVDKIIRRELGLPVLPEITIAEIIAEMEKRK